MTGIFFVNEIYVVVKDETIEVEKIQERSELILNSEIKDNNFLYGGRVSLDMVTLPQEEINITIDGIVIYEFSDDYSNYGLTRYHSWEMICAYLNQIHNLGVDSFLENYKASLVALKLELTNETEKLEQKLTHENDEKNTKELLNIKSCIRKLVYVLFALSINMNAGLDNHLYTDAYNSVINLLF